MFVPQRKRVDSFSEPPRLDTISLDTMEDSSFNERRERIKSNHDSPTRKKSESGKEHSHSKSFTKGLKKSISRFPTFHKSKKHVDISGPFSSRDPSPKSRGSPSGMIVEDINL